MFTITGRGGAGRLGRLRTAHGDVTTPTLMPVVNPNIDLVTPTEMRDLFGCEMVITNSYVMHKHAALREAALARGVHDLIGWDGALMTDSGTFQMYVYGDVEVGPEDIVAFQRDIGVDVATCLDHFVTPDMTRAEAEAAVKTTLDRTRDAVAVAKAPATPGTFAARTTTPPSHAAKPRGAPPPSHPPAAQAAPPTHGASASPGPILNATVQGGLFGDLRQACAAAYRELDIGYHTIGGVVPVMERQMYPQLVDIILHSQQHLRRDRPVHLFGAGHPLVFPLAVALGCDLFDSSSYAKYAKDGRVMTPEGTLHVGDLVEWPFASAHLAGWTPAELTKALAGRADRAGHARHVDTDAARDASKRIRDRAAADPAFAAERALALHNLDVCFADLRRIRQAMRDGVLWEVVEQRATCHPMLAAATRSLGRPEVQAWLEAREAVSGPKALRYTGSLTHRRPVFQRLRQRLCTRVSILGDDVESDADTPYAVAGQQRPEAAMHKEPAGKPFGDALGDGFDAAQDHFVIHALGPTPLGLDEAYPFSQSVLPRLDGLDREHMAWVGDSKDALLAAYGLMPGIPGPPGPTGRLDRDFLQVLRTADWQFGYGAGLVLTGAAPADAVRAALQAVADEAPARTLVAAGAGTWQDADRGRGVLAGSDAMAAPTGGPLRELTRGARAGAGFRVERSKATGKIRTVHLDGEHILSLRAGDGLFTLKPAGGRLLHAALPAPAMRVVVAADSVPFNRAGKSVFNQFVLACDDALRPDDECLVVDERDMLVATGQALLVAEETADFGHAMAVKVRDGFPLA